VQYTLLATGGPTGAVDKARRHTADVD